MIRALTFLVVLVSCSRNPSSGPPAEPPPAAAAKETRARTHLAFVLLPALHEPNENGVLAAYEAIAGARGTLKVTPEKPEKGFVSLTFGGDSSVVAGLIPLPVPNGEAEAAHQHSLSSVIEGPELKRHVAHLVVVFRDLPGRTRKDELVRLTHLLAAFAQEADATGIYWRDAAATHTTEFFLEWAKSKDPNEMVVLWSGLQFVRQRDKVSLLSLGMHEQLGLMDLRVTAPLESAEEAMLDAYDLLIYEATREAEVPHGDVVGRTDDEERRVRHETSPVHAGRKVWRVDFP